MIRSFRGSETTALFVTGRSRRPARLARASLRALAQIHAAHQIEDLIAVPGLRIEPLGRRRARHEARLDTRTTLRFVWRDGDAYEVELAARPSGGRSAPRRHIPVTPGEILREDFLRPARSSGVRLARALRVPAARVAGLLSGRGRITAELALRLGLHFGCTPQFWLNLQMSHDLQAAIRRSGDRIAREVVKSSSRGA